MRCSTSATLLLTLLLLAISGFCQTKFRRGDDKNEQSSPPLTSEANYTTEESGGIALLKRAEAEAAALDGKMRAWALWQIGMAYQTSDRAKALDLFERALASSRAIREDSSAKKSANDPTLLLTGHPPLSPGLRLQAGIARSIVLLEPKRGDEIVGQIDPAARDDVLVSLLVHQEKEKHFDEALETLKRITVQYEMPYDEAMRLMDSLKPEQSGELMQLFLTALASYRDHAPHLQFRDQFPVMLSRYWKRLPRGVVRQAIDEVLKQSADSEERGGYTVVTETSASTLGSIYEFRLAQIMPVLREIDASAARQYQEKYPALASILASSDTADSVGSGTTSFRPSHGYNSSMFSATEMPTAQKAAAQVDSDLAEEAMSQASGITDTNLRAQTYEYIARATAKKHANTAAKAIESMLDAAKKLEPSEGFPYYSSAADIYMQIGQRDDAKKSIEAGLDAGDKLYQADSDEDDPNTALKAYWPSTNAYCALLRQAARISPTWALSLLRNIKDPEVEVAAEIALAGGWLKAPIGPSTLMITKKGSNSFSTSARE